MKARQQAGPPREDSQNSSLFSFSFSFVISGSLFFSLFFFFFFFFFFGGGGGGAVFCCFFVGDGSGTPLVDGNCFRVTARYYWYSIEMSHLGEGTNNHFSLHSKCESYIQITITMWLSNFDVDSYNFTMDNFKLNSASYRTGTFL